MANVQTILIVDDDRFARVILKDVLSSSGYSLAEAADGEEALAAIQTQQPEVILLDLFMPRKSGLDVLAEARRLSPDSRVVVISSMETEKLIQQALDQGAIGFIGKPFHPLEVTTAVQNALRA